MDSICEAAIRGVQQWMYTIPAGVAELRTASLSDRDAVIMDISPANYPAAAAVMIAFSDHTFDLSAGEWFRIAGISCPVAQPVDFVKAIAAGGLTETKFSRNDHVVGAGVELRVEGRILHKAWYPGSGRESSGRARWKQLLGRRRKVTSRPVPYYQFAPSYDDPATPVLVTPPFVVAEGYDLSTHRTLEVMEGSIEVPEVLNNALAIYDCRGRLLQARIPSGRPRGPVEVVAIDVDPTHAFALREVLSEYLSVRQASHESVAKSSLQELVANMYRSFRE